MRIKKSLMTGLVAVGTLFSAMAAQAETLSALFMAQAAYSEDDIRSMTEEFKAAHPGVDVKLEFVSYEALHDKIVLAQGAGDAGYDVVLFDVIWPAEFAKFNFLEDVSSRISADVKSKILDGAWTTVNIPFADFIPQFRGYQLDGPALDPAQITGMGLMIYDNLDGPFELELASVHAY